MTGKARGKEEEVEELGRGGQRQQVARERCDKQDIIIMKCVGLCMSESRFHCSNTTRP